MAVNFYHATTEKAARAIELSEFRPGIPEKRRFAGAGIYFSDNKESAIRHCFNGAALRGDRSKKAEVVIICNVDFGRRLDAEKYTVDKDVCFARGYDSVHINGTDTYAVYDSARISIQKFVRIADDESWYPAAAEKAAAKAKTDAEPAARRKGQRQLTGQQKGQRQLTKEAKAKAADRAAAQAKAAAEKVAAEKAAAAERRRLVAEKAAAKASCLTSCASTSVAPLDVMVAAIKESLAGSLNVTRDISQLCSKHPALHQALCAAGWVTGFCTAHPELSRDGHLLTISSTVLKTSNPLEILVAAIYASYGSINVSSDISQLCSKHPDLPDALRAVGSLAGFRCLLGVQ